jgi:hypothetical protein
MVCFFPSECKAWLQRGDFKKKTAQELILDID